MPQFVDIPHDISLKLVDSILDQLDEDDHEFLNAIYGTWSSSVDRSRRILERASIAFFGANSSLAEQAAVTPREVGGVGIEYEAVEAFAIGCHVLYRVATGALNDQSEIDLAAVNAVLKKIGLDEEAAAGALSLLKLLYDDWLSASTDRELVNLSPEPLDDLRVVVDLRPLIANIGQIDLKPKKFVPIASLTLTTSGAQLPYTFQASKEDLRAMRDVIERLITQMGQLGSSDL